jgi:hypothetical protein
MAATIPRTQFANVITPPRLKIPRRFSIVWIMTLCFVIVNMSAILLGRHSPPPPDVFSSHTGILGQGKSASLVQGFSCGVGAYPILPDEYCTHDLATGPFSRVGLVIGNGVVSRIDFTVRANDIRIGDAILLWGRPNVHTRGRVVDLFWTGSGVSASAVSPNGQFSYFLTLWSVSFTEDTANLRCLSAENHSLSSSPPPQ